MPSWALTWKVRRRPSTAISSARAVTVAPTGVAARCLHVDQRADRLLAGRQVIGQGAHGGPLHQAHHLGGGENADGAAAQVPGRHLGRDGDAALAGQADGELFGWFGHGRLL